MKLLAHLDAHFNSSNTGAVDFAFRDGLPQNNISRERKETLLSMPMLLSAAEDGRMDH